MFPNARIICVGDSNKKKKFTERLRLESQKEKLSETGWLTEYFLTSNILIQ